MSENLHIAITGDNQGFINALNGARAGVRATQQQVEQSGGSIEQMFDRIKAAAAGALAGFSAKAFIQQVVQIRGEFQQLEAAFTTLLGSAEKASKMMEDMTRLAATTPFDLKGVASGAQQLLAYGVAADEITDTLTRLGDIAAGLSLPLNDLVYLYGTTLTQGRMYTMDLRQFMGRGIPMAEELAKQFGVTKDKVGELVSEGKVGAEEFKKAIKSMSDEGGKFGGLMDMQSKTITGQISNIEDNLDMMFNNIGKQSEGIINDALSGVGTLVENYETVGKVLLGLVATYGTYKAAVMTVTAIQGLQAAGVGALTVAETAHYGWIVLVEKAQKLLNATMLANPYVLVATAIAGLVATLITLHDSTTAEELAQRNLNSTMETLTEQQKKYNEETESAISLAQDDSKATSDRDAAMQTLIQRYPQIIQKYIDEEGHLRNILEMKKEIAEYDGKKQRQETTDSLKNQKHRYRQVMDIYALVRDGRKLTAEQQKVWDSVYKEYSSTHSMGWYKDKDLYDYAKASFNQYDTKYRRNLTENRISDFTGNNGTLGKLTDAQLKALKKKLQDNQTKGKKNTSVFISELGDYMNYNDRDALLTQVRGMLEARGQKKSTPAQHKAALKAARDEAQRKLDEFDNSSTGYSDEKYEDERKKLVDALDAAEKKYKAAGGGSVNNRNAKTTSKAETEAAQRAERLKEENQKWDEETAKQRREAVYSQEEARIAAITNTSEREREERKLQHRKDLDQLNDQEQDFRRQNYEHNKTVFENSAKGNKNKYTGTIDSTALTADQQAQIDAQRKKVETEYTQWQLDNTKELAKAEQDALNEYLSQYGTMAEQRYAIAKEYAQKIKDVQDGAGTAEEKNWRVRLLERERDIKQADLNAQNMAMGIDWSTAFKGIGNVLSDIAKDTLEKVDEYMKTDEFKKLSADSKKSYTDLRANLVAETGGNTTSPFNFKIWSTIEQQTKTYQQSVKDVMEKEKAHAKALEELEKAEALYAGATDDASKKIAEAAVNAAKGKVETTGKDLNKAKSDSDEAKDNLTDSTEKAVNGLDNFTQALQEVSGGSLKGFADGMVKLVQSIGGKDAKGLSGLGKVGGIVGAILAIIDALGDDPAKFLDDLFTKITGTVETLLEQLFSDVLPTIIQGIGSLAGGIVEGIGKAFGADSGWMYGSNKEEVKEYTERLQRSNDALKSSIDDLKESIDESAGTKAVQSYEEAYAAQKTVISNAASQLEANMGMHDKHHSNAYYWNNGSLFGRRGSGYSQINAILANYRRKNPDAETLLDSVGNLGDIYKLTPEQMNEIRTQNAELWNDMISIGKYDMSQYWEAYADLAGSLEELTEQINENLTQTSFDSLHDNFVSTIMDMEHDMGDFADDFSEMMAKAFVNAQVGNLMDTQLQAFYDSWADRMKNGTLTKSDIEQMRSEYMDLANQALQIRNTMEEVTGYTGQDSQSASANGASSITYDQANQFIGLVTAGNIVRQNIADGVVSAVASLSTLSASAASSNATLSEMRNLMIFGNSYLEDILKVNKSFYNDFVEKMDMSNKYLKEMK